MGSCQNLRVVLLLPVLPFCTFPGWDHFYDGSQRFKHVHSVCGIRMRETDKPHVFLKALCQSTCLRLHYAQQSPGTFLECRFWLSGSGDGAPKPSFPTAPRLMLLRGQWQGCSRHDFCLPSIPFFFSFWRTHSSPILLKAHSACVVRLRLVPPPQEWARASSQAVRSLPRTLQNPSLSPTVRFYWAGAAVGHPFHQVGPARE